MMINKKEQPPVMEADVCNEDAHNHDTTSDANARLLARFRSTAGKVGSPPQESEANSICSDFAIQPRHFRLSGSQGDELSVPSWPQLKEEALFGMAGDFVRESVKDSEADPAAVLFTFNTAMSVAVGNGAWVNVGNTRHSARSNSLIVGATSRGRKGVSASPVKALVEALPPELKFRLTPGPLSSGEGLIYHVRDEGEDLNRDGSPKDSGVADKRLLVIDEEFARGLAAFSRDGNTLATTIRAAYDSGNLDPLTKYNRIKATGAHIGIVTHITSEEIRNRLDDVEIYAGTMNRFFIVCARRSRMVPRPKPFDARWLGEFADRLAWRIEQSRNRGAVEFSKEAEDYWDDVYPTLSRDTPGRLGALTCRTEAQVTRSALLFSLLDEDNDPDERIEVRHLRAALALVAYSVDSARFIYGTSQGNGEPDKICARILRALRGSAGRSLSQTSISGAMGRNVDSRSLGEALMQLQASGRLTQATVGGGQGKGRPTTYWTLTDGFDFGVDEIDENDEIDDDEPD